MTKQEIKDLIAAKIAGQGSAVDVGGALPVILNAMLDLMGAAKTFDAPKLHLQGSSQKSRAEMAEFLIIDADLMDAIIDGNVPTVWDEVTDCGYSVITKQYDTGTRDALFIFGDVYDGVRLYSLSLSRTIDGQYQVIES